MSTITYQVQAILKEYGQNEHYSTLKKAFEQFSYITGKCDSDSLEYEARMNCFNDWYVFNFREGQNKKVFVKYFDENQIDSDMAKSFHNINYSIFKVQKVVKGNIYLFDILHNDTLKVLEEDCSIGLVPEDIFVGRSIYFEKRHYLLKGVCTLPREVFSSLDKYCKAFRNKRMYELETKFVLNLEKLKMKSLNYKHLSFDKIFNTLSFENLK